MDLMVLGFVAVLASVIAALIAVFTKRSRWYILLFGVAGLVLGAGLGYLIAPFIVSFM